MNLEGLMALFINKNDRNYGIAVVKLYSCKFYHANWMKFSSVHIIIGVTLSPNSDSVTRTGPYALIGTSTVIGTESFSTVFFHKLLASTWISDANKL